MRHTEYVGIKPLVALTPVMEHVQIEKAGEVIQDGESEANTNRVPSADCNFERGMNRSTNLVMTEVGKKELRNGCAKIGTGSAVYLAGPVPISPATERYC